jgi:hypothetical protein
MQSIGLRRISVVASVSATRSPLLLLMRRRSGGRVGSWTRTTPARWAVVVAAQRRNAQAPAKVFFRVCHPYVLRRETQNIFQFRNFSVFDGRNK